MSRTGGSTKWMPRLSIMKEVTQKETRSWRRERTINIFWRSLQLLSQSPSNSESRDGVKQIFEAGTGTEKNKETFCHNRPGSGAFSGSVLVNQRFQSRGYCSKEDMMPWKLGNLSSSVMLSQLGSASQAAQGLSICSSLSSTCKHTCQLICSQTRLSINSRGADHPKQFKNSTN